MMSSRCLVVAATIAAVLSGCTGRSRKPVQIDNERPGQEGRDRPAEDAEPKGPLDEDVVEGGGSSSGDDDKSTGDDGPAAGDETATIDVSIEEAPLQKYGIETARLDYKLTYAVAPKYEASDKLQFAAGKAILALKGLPAEQRGDMLLELSSGGILKARAMVTGVTLAKGQANRIEMRPEIISGATSTSTADASIDVVIGNGGGGTASATGTTTTTATGTGSATSTSTGSATSTSTGTGSATSTATGTGSAIGTSTGTGSATGSDPIQSWDGKSFQGNGRWSVRAVDD